MTLISIPNVSEGRDASFIRRSHSVIADAGGRVLDIHSDTRHNRSVITATGSEQALVAGMAALAGETAKIDLTEHTGLHPRLGGLDVCPIVPQDAQLSDAVALAVRVAEEIAERVHLPVYLYEAAARRAETRNLPDLRRGGLEGLAERARHGLAPDFGPREVDPRRGVVCVGARNPLIAFNVYLRCDGTQAQQVAAQLRESAGGLRGVRALAWDLEEGLAQIAMNLIAPETTGVDRVFEEVRRQAQSASIDVVGTEIVGVPPERFLPNPKKEAARLLIRPGRSLESALVAKSV